MNKNTPAFAATPPTAEEIAVLAAAIATEACQEQELRAHAASLVTEVGRNRCLLPPAHIYMLAVRDCVELYTGAYLDLCVAVDVRTGSGSALEAHESTARARARQVASGLWTALRLLPRLREDGSVATTEDGGFEPIGQLKQQFANFGIKDEMRFRSLAVLKPTEVLKEAAFNLGTAKARREALAALSDPDLRADRAVGDAMALRMLVALIEAGALRIEGFSQRLVRARLPAHSTNRRLAIRGHRAGADELSLETIAWCSGPGEGRGRLRVLDLAFDPSGDPLEEVCRLSYESLERIAAELPADMRMLAVFPELLPLGEPHTGIHLLKSQVAVTAEADFLRARPENQRCAAALLAETNRPPPPGWTFVFAANRDRGRQLDFHTLSAQIRRRHRSAERFQTYPPARSWVLSAESSYTSPAQTKEAASLIETWQQGELADRDAMRRAGHRSMYHGNVSAEILDALMQVSLTYTAAEDLVNGLLRTER